jgi:cytochrome c biogenesis protein CcdA
MQDHSPHVFQQTPGTPSALDAEQNYRLEQLEDARDQFTAHHRSTAMRLRLRVLTWSFLVCVLLIVLPYAAVWTGLKAPETLISQTNNLALVFIGYIGGIISSIFGISQDEDRANRPPHPPGT